MIPFIFYGDVGQPIDCGKFQCAMSIEVAEHIMPDQSENFINNLVNAATDLIVLTAAPPDQPGTYHINCREYSFWIDGFIKPHIINIYTGL